MVCFAVFSESTNALNYSIYIRKSLRIIENIRYIMPTAYIIDSLYTT